jgi:hypothetical protein
MITLSILALFYFLPTILAAKRGHDVIVPLLFNLFFGWTVIGWFALLLWALLSWPRYYMVPAHYHPYNDWPR